MAAAPLRLQTDAVTEHSAGIRRPPGLEVLPLQSTTLAANMVFINIDWKASRHNKTLKANMRLLNKTIFGVVCNMNPAMICMCEVGLVKDPLTSEQMKQVAEECLKAWRRAAGEHLELTSMFQVGEPYMTVYRNGLTQCTSHRILQDLYCAQGRPRTAQTFLCRGPGGDTADVINVHAPSGTHSLCDEQRRNLLKKLLQSDSRSVLGTVIGRARFLIGGDMNTDPFKLSQL